MIIATMSSLPKRISNLEHVIKSIYDEVDEIHLNIPNYCKRLNEYYNINKINELKKFKKIKIFITDDNGSMTKLLDTMKRVNKNDYILVIDDDQIYHKKFINELIKISKDYSLVSRRIAGFKNILVHEAWAGYIINMKFITKKIIDELEYITKNIKYGNYTDDLNISFVLNKHKLKTYSLALDYDDMINKHLIYEIVKSNDGALKGFQIMNLKRYEHTLKLLIFKYGNVNSYCIY